MNQIQDIYPLATQEGTSIPLEIVKPIGAFMEDFTDSASPIRTLDTTDCILAIYSTAEVLIKFGGQAAATISDGTYAINTVFIPKYCVFTIAPPSEKFSIISAVAGGAGKCYINLLRRWVALTSTENLYKRK